MTRVEALDALDAVLQLKWIESKKAFENTKAGATGDEVKQEGKYDTRGIEESYLAHGLANAVIEHEDAISALNACRTSAITSKTSLGSLVECKSGQSSLYFLISKNGGGIEAQVGESEVTIITPESPLARNLLGKQAGDQLVSPPFSIIRVY